MEKVCGEEKVGRGASLGMDMNSSFTLVITYYVIRMLMFVLFSFIQFR